MVTNLYGEERMPSAIMLQINPQEIIEAVRRMKRKERQSFVEDLIAATSPEYLDSIREARGDYSAGRKKTHEEVFGG